MKLTKIEDFDVIEWGRFYTYENAVAFARQAAEEKIGGFTDWVLPDTHTLRSLALLASSHFYAWSSSPYVGNSGYAWIVNFYNGNVNSSYRSSYLNHVRLVRASQCLAIGLAGYKKSLADAGIKVEQS